MTLFSPIKEVLPYRHQHLLVLGLLVLLLLLVRHQLVLLLQEDRLAFFQHLAFLQRQDFDLEQLRP
jgi:hypothetical protein